MEGKEWRGERRAHTGGEREAHIREGRERDTYGRGVVGVYHIYLVLTLTSCSFVYACI